MSNSQSNKSPIPVDVFTGPQEACDAVARTISDLIRKRDAEDKRTVLGLATGSTPLRLYRSLINLHRNEGLSFKNVVTFNLDEYLGLAPEHPQSYRHFMEQNLFAHVDIPAEQTHIPTGLVSDAEIPALCERYEEAIRAAGGIDLQILGIGRTGHIGFNEPGSSPASRTRSIELNAITREDAAPNFGGLDKVPTQAITMGIATILEARQIYLLAWGQNKAEIVARALYTEPTGTIPATFLQTHGNTRFCVDKEAASDLPRQ